MITEVLQMPQQEWDLWMLYYDALNSIKKKKWQR